MNDSLLVLAPMGTGKTRTAAAAIRQAIESGILPEQILGLTFTNRAAEAMRTAVSETLPKESHRVQLFNLHGLCARFLREEAPLALLPPDFGILDEDEAAETLWQYIPRADREERFKNKSTNALGAYEKFVFQYLMGDEPGPTPPAFIFYRDSLHRDGLVDFTGLIARTYRVLKLDAAARERWQSRFRWMLVDEIQDINLAEYRIISILGESHRKVKFFGDHHQTIYEWRFAQPQEVVDSFVRQFSPRRFALRTNYRCSQKLVEATNALRKTYIPSTEPFPQAVDGVRDGDLTLQAFDRQEAETEAVVRAVSAWRKAGIPCSQIAVLARNNRTLIEISSALKGADIPHLVAEEFDFFRRQEVKDVTALLEHLVSPFRRHPIVRLLKRMGVQPARLESLEAAAMGTGLHLGYMVRGSPGDPLHPLIEAWGRGKVVALDTETTGLDPLFAEVIQFARRGQAGFGTCEWIRPTGKVGESVHTHGITDEFLAREGKDPRAVLEAGLRFAEGEVLLGHNLAFDLRLLASQARRLGFYIKTPVYFDTMPLASALLPKEKLSGLRLETVSRALGIETPKAHDADADAQTCLSIVEKLHSTLLEMQPVRMRLIAELGSELGLAMRKVTELSKRAREIEEEGHPVSELIGHVWKLLKEIPGTHDYRSNPARQKNIDDLAGVARFLQERRGPLSLPHFLEQVALSRRDMILEADPERIRLLSAHASKGLEFEAVALPRLIAPWQGYSDEEARVFYVMLTRARRHVWMSWPRSTMSRWGREQSCEPLKYLSAMDGFAVRL